MNYELSEINLYPIKSTRGHSTPEAHVDERGIEHDHRWMIVDENGRFLSQREVARLALITTRITEEMLVLEAPGRDGIEVPLKGAEPESEAIVWQDRCRVVDKGEAVAEWLRSFLGRRARLVHIAENFVRPVDPDYAIPGSQVGFADGFPFLITTEASLADLNTRLDEPLPMNRFRPNLVIRGSAPLEEHTWSKIRVGSVVFQVVKPCARCVITTTDQMTAERGREPLVTLGRYRRVGNKAIFGENAIHESTGILRVGDPVQVLERRRESLLFEPGR